jgi:ribosomal protein S20
MPRKKKTDDNASAKTAAKTYEKEVQQLLEKGRKNTKIEQHEIFDLIPDVPANIDILEQLYAELDDDGVALIPIDEPTKE